MEERWISKDTKLALEPLASEAFATALADMQWMFIGREVNYVVGVEETNEIRVLVTIKVEKIHGNR